MERTRDGNSASCGNSIGRFLEEPKGIGFPVIIKAVLGGGVMHQEQMLPLVKEEVKRQLNGYICTKELEDMDSYIVLPSLNDNQGIMGALQLALNEKGE